MHASVECGLKARATLAWGNAPGRCAPTTGGLKARAKCLDTTLTPAYSRQLRTRILTWGVAPGYDNAGLQPAVQKTNSPRTYVTRVLNNLIPYKPLIERDTILRKQRAHLRPKDRIAPAQTNAPSTRTPSICGLRARHGNATLAWATPQVTAPPRPAGLKARATLAWGNAPGPCAPTTGGLKARAECLIPHEPLIKRHIIFRKHGSHLCLKIPPGMMPALVIDIPNQRGSVRQTNRKRRVPLLPAKFSEVGPFRLDPLGRGDLQLLDHPGHGRCPREIQSNVNMVGNTANADTDVLGMAKSRRQIGVHLGPYGVIQPRPPILRAKHQMDQNKRKRLRHGCEPSPKVALPHRPLARAFSPQVLLTTPTWGVAPGYASAGLQPANLLAPKSFRRSTCTMARAFSPQVLLTTSTWGVVPGYDGACLQPA